MSTILDKTTANDFVRDIWQQKSAVFRQVLAPAQLVAADGDTLAGLACEPEIDSRIVIRNPANTDWDCETGPFSEERFQTLPPTGWTLLVQGVDRWLDDVGSLLNAFDFLPRWRLDDIMVSYATLGGGVGPHFDYYDVFLLQAEGEREWHIGPRCDETTPLRDHPTLRLLEHFPIEQTHLLQAGDMLYVPAGVAHWGTATTDICITWSIGFRAPTFIDIMAQTLVELKDGDDVRYRDTPAAIDRDPYRINDAATDRLMEHWLSLDKTALREAMTRAFGHLVTESFDAESTSAPDCTPEIDDPAIRGVDIALIHDGASRLAYAPTAQGAYLFVNGEAHATTLALAQGICHGYVPANLTVEPSAQALLTTLFRDGHVSFRPR